MIAIASLVLVLAQVEPEPPAVNLTLGSTNLVLGIDQETELRVQVNHDVDEAETPRIFTSAGHVDDLTRTGVRSWVGRYVLLAERFL